MIWRFQQDRYIARSLTSTSLLPLVIAVSVQVMSAAKSAATLLSGMIPDLHVDISTPSSTLLAPTKLFSVEAGG